jgi:N-acetylmuramic acid 6-phosphate etherase
MSVGGEKVSTRFRGLDTWATSEILTALWNGQMQAVAACLPALGALAKAVDAAAERLSAGGRLVYVGAGSSGVIAALDATELGATFDWPEARLSIILPAGLDLSKEQAGPAEDDPEAGAARIDADAVSPADVVIAVSASGRSAFTIGALKRAARRGALTIAFANNSGSPLGEAAAHAVVVETGAEVIAGSTRLGAGTAQKVMFNLFSTALMTRLGAIHDNLMINVRADNAKLRQRCAAMVAHIAGVDADRAAEALARHGSVKRAVLALAGVAEDALDACLAAADGVLRKALTDKDIVR